MFLRCSNFQVNKSLGCKELSVEELQDAKLFWCLQIQREVYQAEYERLPLPNTGWTGRRKIAVFRTRLSSIKLSYHKGIQWSKRSYRVCTRSCFILDQRVPFRSCDKRFGSPRDAVRLRVFWESALFVNVHASTYVHKRWSHYRWGANCHLRPSLMSE